MAVIDPQLQPIKQKNKFAKPELLLPAGDVEKLRYAIAYGADAVYLGLPVASLRTVHSKEPFTPQNLKQHIQYCHQHNVKAYVTLNIFANNHDIKRLIPHIEQLAEMGPDAFILSDPGIFALAKKHAPNVPIHISTQANTLNVAACQFWQDLGCERVILAREVPLREMAEIKEALPDLEVECFVHGSLCVAYSGRCLISDYLTDNTKNSNKGMCGNSCRWEFEIKEKNRPDAEYTLVEDERGSFLLNSKDLCLVRYLKELMDAGICSFKVEGRTKSLHYVATIGRVYREAIDQFYSNAESIDSIQITRWEDELLQAANRGFTEGFLFGKPGSTGQNYPSSQSTALGKQFCALATGKKLSNAIEVTGRNPFKQGDTLEAIWPDGIIQFVAEKMEDANGLPLTKVNPNQVATITLEPDNPLNTLDTEALKWVMLRS